MSQSSFVHAALVATGLFGVCVAAHADGEFTIDSSVIQSSGCSGLASCDLGGAELSTTGGSLQNKTLNGATGFGVSGGVSGSEIDIGQKLRVDYDESRSIIAIQILFLFNGPEFGDKAEKAQVSADGVPYTLSVLNNEDDASASWSGPGSASASVSKCPEPPNGDTTETGTGCFVITDPFPGAVSRLDFTAVEGSQPFPPSGGPGSNDSDYSIGVIESADFVLSLDNCETPTGCPVAAKNGQVAASFNNMETTGGSGETPVTEVQFPDCRYIPDFCVDLLPPASDNAATGNAAYEILIGLGVIKPLVSIGPNRYRPAGQLLNVKPLLKALYPEITSQFDSSGVPPNGLPNLYIDQRWHAQAENNYLYDGLFFETDPTVVFSDTFEGLIDVSKLTGSELGCFPILSNLLAWDAVTAVSELARSVDGLFTDMMLNVGCENPTKVSGTRLSLYVVNSEITHTTLGPTITSSSTKLTENNDAVFARLVQKLWKDIGAIRTNYACKQADPVPTGGVAPLSKSVCGTLKTHWDNADNKLSECVKLTFQPVSLKQTNACAAARGFVDAFAAAIPEEATGPDPYNRRGELESRTENAKHVWDTRFTASIKPLGFCREKGTCPP